MIPSLFTFGNGDIKTLFDISERYSQRYLGE